MNDDPESVGAWFVSDESKELFRKVSERWAKLEAWGVAQKLPNVHLQVDAWKAFSKAWRDGDEDVSDLSTKNNEVELVERYAREKGYAVQPRIAGVDVEATKEPLKVAASVDQGARVVTDVVREAGRDAAQGLGNALGFTLAQIPTSVKAVGGLAVVGVVAHQLNKLIHPAPQRKTPAASAAPTAPTWRSWGRTRPAGALDEIKRALEERKRGRQ